jgi:nociceptin receptor
MVYFIAALYSVLAITGLLGNLWVLSTVLNQLSICVKSRTSTENGRRRLILPGVQSSACIYLLMLSVVDLISFVPVPFLAMDIIRNKWTYNNVICKLLYTCEGVNKSLSPWILTALSVDRYIAVCRPTFIWMRESRFALCISIICVLFSSLFIAPLAFAAEVGNMRGPDGKIYRKCAIKMSKSYDILHLTACYIVPLFLICSVYIAILRRLYIHTRKSSVGRKTSINLKRVVKCSVLVVAFYFCCWTPVSIMRLLHILNRGRKTCQKQLCLFRKYYCRHLRLYGSDVRHSLVAVHTICI